MHNHQSAEPDAHDGADPTYVELEPSWFNSLTGGADKSLACARDAIESIVSQLAYQAKWILETGPGGEFTLEVQSHDPRNSLTLVISLLDHKLILTIIPDPSGWLRITACWADAPEADEPLFEGWLDQPYEEFEFWPRIHYPASMTTQPGPNQIAPGRMGKRMNWVSIEASAWPAHDTIHRLRNSHGFVVASQVDGD